MTDLIFFPGKKKKKKKAQKQNFLNQEHKTPISKRPVERRRKVSEREFWSLNLIPRGQKRPNGWRGLKLSKHTAVHEMHHGKLQLWNYCA